MSNRNKVIQYRLVYKLVDKPERILHFNHWPELQGFVSDFNMKLQQDPDCALLVYMREEAREVETWTSWTEWTNAMERRREGDGIT